MEAWLQYALWGNSVRDYLIAAGTFAVVLAAFMVVRRVVLNRLGRLAGLTDTKLDDLAVELLEMIRSPERYLLAFYAASRPLTLAPWLDKAFHAAVVLSLTYRAVTMVQRVVRYLVDEVVFTEGDGDPAYRQTSRAVLVLVNFFIWAGALVFVLDNLGFDVTSMLAGLGIGGVAIALAAQAVLGDLFAAVALFLDRPFVVGDFIVTGDTVGTIEEIGVKTTRVRALSGELLVLPNSTLASARIQNFKQMSARRVVFKFGVVYQTSAEKLRRAPGIVKGIIEASAKARFDRVHFMNYGDSSLDFEAVYYVLSPDYNVYMDTHQAILLAVFEAFEKEGLSFAYPTRTLHIESQAAPA